MKPTARDAFVLTTMDEEEEDVGRMGMKRLYSTRGNSSFKWKEDKTVLGALEVKSEPVLDVKAKMKKLKIISSQSEFDKALSIWKERKLRKAFVEACDSIPPVTQCCGLVTDSDKTIANLANELNKGWIKKINGELKDQGFKIGCYEWSWRNPSGKAETKVLLIRFHSLTTRKSQITRASLTTGRK